MNPVRTFDQITQEILNKNDFETITVGILIADGNQLIIWICLTENLENSWIFLSRDIVKIYLIMM